jgi:MscS family membrane protein
MTMQSLKNVLQPLLPNFFFERYFFELHLWQWLVLFAAAVLAYFLSYGSARMTVYMVRRTLLKRTAGIDRQSLRRVFTPLRSLYLVAIIAIFVPFLGLSTAPGLIVKRCLELAAIAAFTWLAFRIFDVAMDAFARQLIEKGRVNIVITMPLFRRAGKIAFGLLGAVMALKIVVDDITVIVAYLSVFGVALALASQKTLENLFGGLMLILDQPIRVGQECKFGTQQGTVEDIGLRTTRIRTQERSIVAVPNGEFSQMQIENLSRRDRIRFLTTFGLRYETTPDQLRAVLIAIREILYAHPKVDREPARVRFVNFGSQSLDIEISAYVLTSVNHEYLAVKEDIFLRIMDVVHASGTAFAIPSQVVYHREQEFLDSKRQAEAEARVAQMRLQNELPLPEFSEEQILKLDDTIDYPPKGASTPDLKGRYG